ncbi:MAG: FHA domain-containing protein [Gemmatimonadota bacterium]|nr:FHA domain-containing protein [Gemmatimonadota bacterium]
MSFLIIDRERYALQLGDTTLGGLTDELLAQSPLSALPPFAVLSAGPDGEATIRALPGGAPTLLGGRPLTVQPHAIRHGDRMEVGGRTILYGDLSAAGRTSAFVGISVDDATLLAGMALPASDATATTGGRLIELSDDTRHDIPTTGVVIGRDPECGIIIKSSAVSRRHASIAPGLLGYMITDESTNGVFVNGARIEGATLLRQGDRIRIGTTELRFEADQAVYEPAPAMRPVEPTPVAPIRPPAAPMEKPALLATLEVLTRGLQEGKRFRIERNIAQIGRGTHNDVHLADDSVSGSHATLMRRGPAWYLVDLGSRNGSYVDGTRVTEQQLTSGSELRLGNVKLLFRVLASAPADDGSTRGIVGLTEEQLRAAGWMKK